MKGPRCHHRKCRGEGWEEGLASILVPRSVGESSKSAFHPASKALISCARCLSSLSSDTPGDRGLLPCELFPHLDVLVVPGHTPLESFPLQFEHTGPSRSWRGAQGKVLQPKHEHAAVVSPSPSLVPTHTMSSNHVSRDLLVTPLAS